MSTLANDDKPTSEVEQAVRESTPSSAANELAYGSIKDTVNIDPTLLTAPDVDEGEEVTSPPRLVLFIASPVW